MTAKRDVLGRRIYLGFNEPVHEIDEQLLHMTVDQARMLDVQPVPYVRKIMGPEVEHSMEEKEDDVDGG